MVLGAKRLGWKIEAKRLGGKCLGGETSCDHMETEPVFSVSSNRLEAEDLSCNPGSQGKLLNHCPTEQVCKWFTRDKLN